VHHHAGTQAVTKEKNLLKPLLDKQFNRSVNVMDRVIEDTLAGDLPSAGQPGGSCTT
jgi:hypothetical protein